ncbi:hypothetical protein [Marinoscillum sp.]|uniref:hypothetical protein n=1 Tax=Marinoscillum sp. TaxID=2024838 RepID=UPI003BAD5F20
MEDQYLPFFITEDLYLLDEIIPESVKETPTAPVVEEEVETHEESVVEEPPATIAPPIVHELAIWSPPLTAQDKELLVKILAAINEDFKKAKLMEGINAYEPHYQKLLCFGYQKELELKLGTTVEFYQPTKVADRQILVSAAPADLHTDKNEKGRLWTALQEMFLK